MARPKSASDREILLAAHRVYARRGRDGFTLSEVAREVGISRAAIIQRFRSTKSLKLTLSQQMVQYFSAALDALPAGRGGDALLSLASFIARMVPDRGQLGAFLQNFQADLQDIELAALEKRRGAIMYAAISERMPDVAIAHDSAVASFAAHIGGSLMQWQANSEEGDVHEFLVSRTRAWLMLAGVEFSAQLTEYPTIAVSREEAVLTAADPAATDTAVPAL